MLTCLYTAQVHCCVEAYNTPAEAVQELKNQRKTWKRLFIFLAIIFSDQERLLQHLCAIYCFLQLLLLLSP